MKPFSLPTTLRFGLPLVNGLLIFAAILPTCTMADPVLPPPPNLAEAKADPIHHLVELATRTRNKPHDLLRDSDGCYPSERVVFRDTNTGCELWRMSRNPGYNRHHYASYPIWNADGTKLIVRSQRPGDDTWWLINADGSRWTGAGKNFTCWHATDPNKFFTSDQPRHGAEGSESTISETELTTGQSRVLWRLPAENIEMPPPSPDGRKLLVVQKGGQADGKPRTFAWVLNSDGTGEAARIDLKTDVHQIWLLKRDDYAFTFNEEWRTLKEDYHDRQWICEPSKGGAVRIFDPNVHFNHTGVSPDGHHVAYMSVGGVSIADMDTGVSRVCVSAHGGHVSWDCDPQWFIASIDEGIYQVWPEENRARLLCVPNSKLGYATVRTETEPVNSPDGTKFGYASSMMGDCDLYVAVQRQPDPPRHVRREGRTLRWDAPGHARELAGYGVYRGAELLTREPLRQTKYKTPDDGGEYTVVAIEHSGLQSPCPDRQPPSVPGEVKASASSPFAISLDWQPPKENDVLYYNVYCSTQATVAPTQEHRVASPSDSQVMDWGLRANTEYHYIVTAVDRAGNEGPPCPTVTFRTPKIDSVLERVDVAKALGTEPVSIPLQAPRDGRYMLWFELKAGAAPKTETLKSIREKSGGKAGGVREGRQRPDLKQAFEMQLDGKRIPTWTPFWDMVCDDRDGPAPVPFFDTYQSEKKCNAWLSLKAGSHEIQVSLPKGAAEILSVTLTNDAGFVPEGITSFLAPGPNAKKKTKVKE